MIITLTGRVGAGKSTVAQMFKKHGAHIIDADKIGHDLFSKDDVKKKIKKTYGQKVFTGKEIDRTKLAEIVFTDKSSLETLNQLIHPLIELEIKHRIKNEAVNIVELPLPTKAALTPAKVIYVYAPKLERAKRLLAKKMPARDISNRMRFEESPERHDFTINNLGDEKSLETQVNIIWRHLNEKKSSNVPGKLRSRHKRPPRHHRKSSKTVRHPHSSSDGEQRKTAAAQGKRPNRAPQKGNSPPGKRGSGPVKRPANQVRTKKKV